jgi:small subunit ribosomal protein S5
MIAAIRFKNPTLRASSIATAASPFQERSLIFSSLCTRFASGKKQASSFRPRRNPSKSYRPFAVLKPKKKQADWNPVQLGNVKNPLDDLDATFGPLAADVIRVARREREIRRKGLDEEDSFEKELRMANYFTAATGSVEDMVTERRALAMDIPDENERRTFLDDLETMIEVKQREIMKLDGSDERDEEDEDRESDPSEEEEFDDERDPDVHIDHTQLAHGDWSEMLITVDRNIKLWRGGRLESYRALVIGGNMEGCAGFGIGKALDPMEAVDVAGRISRRNIFFVDRYQGDGITRDLVGKQNSCVVALRATNNGLRGNELIKEILLRFGITNCVSKSHGNRSPYNVVRATFKAIMTHESLEDIAMKRGKRLVSMDRAIRMQI